MIAYLQEETWEIWENRIASWIQELIDSGQPGWSDADSLDLEFDDSSRKLTVFRSLHSRDVAQDMELRHLWLNMN
jgi:hypothetical protein